MRGLEVFGYHGAQPHEAITGQLFGIDIDLFLDTAAAAAADDLALTVDYGWLADQVVEVVTAERHDLIETLAHSIAGACMELDMVTGCEITVHKPAAPIRHPFQDGSVTVRYPR